MRSFNSRYAFYALVVMLRAATICDVGSCDAQQAIRFKRLRRRARVIAFEANPTNFTRIAEMPLVRRLGIQLVPNAVADVSGEVTFYLLEQRSDKQWAKGSSSLNRRTPEMNPGLSEIPTTVEAVRLDEFLASHQGPIALWIDVEGAADRAVEGLRGIADRIAVIHIELEKEPLWIGQETSEPILETLREMGFCEVGRSDEWRRQENVVLVRGDARTWQQLAIRTALASASAYGWSHRAARNLRRRAASTGH